MHRGGAWRPGLPLACLGLAALATLACAQAQAPPDAGGCADHGAAFPALVGMTEPEAIAALERLPGIRTVRVGGPGAPMTRDYRPDRATVLLREGRVESIACG